MARIKVRGLASIDMRTVAARDLIAWRNELLAALGGTENVAPQKLALVDMAVRTRLYIDHIDAFLMSQGSLVNRRRKAILPVLRERTQLVDSQSRLLQQIGLDRVEKNILNAERLAEIESVLAERDPAFLPRTQSPEEKPTNDEPQDGTIDAQPKEAGLRTET
jgi:hypothetical protein